MLLSAKLRVYCCQLLLIKCCRGHKSIAIINDFSDLCVSVPVLGETELRCLFEIFTHERSKRQDDQRWQMIVYQDTTVTGIPPEMTVRTTTHHPVRQLQMLSSKVPFPRGAVPFPRGALAALSEAHFRSLQLVTTHNVPPRLHTGSEQDGYNDHG